MEAGRIPSARPVDRADFTVNEPVPGLALDKTGLRRLLESRGVGPTSEVVLYGDGGPEPYRLWWALREAGVRTRVLDGGLGAWTAAGHRLAEGPVADAERAAPRAQTDPDSPLLQKDLTQLLEGAVLIDTRSVEEFRGEWQDPRAARAGHVPGARHLDWWTVFRDDEDRRLASPDIIRAVAAEVGAVPERRVVTMCQSGTRTAAVHFAFLQAGFPEASLTLYDGSWADYSRRLELPVKRTPEAP